MKIRTSVGEYLREGAEKLTIWIAAVSSIIFYISSAFGICIVIWQTFHWMSAGVWTPVPLSAVFLKLGEDLDSVYNPQSWIGIAKIVQ